MTKSTKENNIQPQNPELNFHSCEMNVKLYSPFNFSYASSQLSK